MSPTRASRSSACAGAVRPAANGDSEMMIRRRAVFIFKVLPPTRSVEALRDAAALFEQRVRHPFGRGLGVDAQDGLGARLSEEEPRLVAEDELRAVERLDCFDRVPVD